jgi:hypothetical protein
MCARDASMNIDIGHGDWSWNVVCSWGSVKVDISVCPSEQHPLNFSIPYKKYQAVQNVCFVYREKEKSSMQKG